MDSVFFWVSKFTWFLIAPANLLVLLLFIGSILLWKQRIQIAKRFFTFLCLLVLVIGLFPVGEWLLYPLESKYKANPELEQVDGVIVLGGALDATLSAIWQQTVVNGNAERVLASLVLMKKFPNAKLVYIGGSGSLTNQQFKEADAALQFYKEHGLNTAKIIFERESRNTSENAIFTKKLINPAKDEKWLLITSARHMPRSVAIFCKSEWSVIPYPVDFRTKPKKLFRIAWSFGGHLMNLSIGIKEWLGRVAYSFMGEILLALYEWIFLIH